MHSLNGTTYKGKLAGNGEWVQDTLPTGNTLPSNYTTGDWSGIYNAGAEDTSVWEMTYTGPPIGAPGSIRLIR